MVADRAEFEAVFPELVDEILSDISKTKISQEALDRLKETLLYNTLGGKLNRGLSIIDTYQILTGKTELSKEEYRKIAVLGWTVELLQAFFLVADDIMDDSKTRRGQLCWYRKPGVGMIAINDSFLLESAIYILLKRYFRSESYYLDLVELYHEITLYTELGQLLDLITAPEDEIDLSKFSLDKHNYIVTYKTAFYSFYLPVALAMYVAGKATPQNLQQARTVLVPLGAYFQVQDDYLDCYGDPKLIGKIGTDIQDNKCSWLINVAVEQANAEQRKVLDENYGRKNSESELKVKKVFDELKLVEIYHKYEDKTAHDIRSLIAQTDESEGLKKDVFTKFFDKIYKRQK